MTTKGMSVFAQFRAAGDFSPRRTFSRAFLLVAVLMFAVVGFIPDVSGHDGSGDGLTPGRFAMVNFGIDLNSRPRQNAAPRHLHGRFSFGARGPPRA